MLIPPYPGIPEVDFTLPFDNGFGLFRALAVVNIGKRFFQVNRREHPAFQLGGIAVLDEEMVGFEQFVVTDLVGKFINGDLQFLIFLVGGEVIRLHPVLIFIVDDLSDQFDGRIAFIAVFLFFIPDGDMA